MKPYHGVLEYLYGLNRHGIKLGLDPTIDEFELVFGNVSEAVDEIAVTTNSVLEILLDLADYFEVPPEHITDGWTGPTIAPAPNEPEQRAPILAAAVRQPLDDGWKLLGDHAAEAGIDG